MRLGSLLVTFTTTSLRGPAFQLYTVLPYLRKGSYFFMFSISENSKLYPPCVGVVSHRNWQGEAFFGVVGGLEAQGHRSASAGIVHVVVHTGDGNRLPCLYLITSKVLFTVRPSVSTVTASVSPDVTIFTVTDPVSGSFSHTSRVVVPPASEILTEEVEDTNKSETSSSSTLTLTLGTVTPA